MNTLSNVINLIKEDLYAVKSDDACLVFFYSSMLNYAISLEIASFKQNISQTGITFEELCKNIPKKLGSRSSIKTVLDNGFKAGFFIKKFKSSDKRSKSYTLSEEYSLMLTNWYLNRKERYAS